MKSLVQQSHEKQRGCAVDINKRHNEQWKKTYSSTANRTVKDPGRLHQAQLVEKWLALKKFATFKTGSDHGSFISDESDNVNCQEELDLLQEHLTDSKLNSLPMDPRLWTPGDVRNWLHHMTEIHNIQVDLSFFQMNGRGLCLMSLNGFLFRVPVQGKLLYEDFRERLKQCLLAPGHKAIKPTIKKLSTHDVERRSVLENGKMSPLVYHTL